MRNVFDATDLEDRMSVHSSRERFSQELQRRQDIGSHLHTFSILHFFRWLKRSDIRNHVLSGLDVDKLSKIPTTPEYGIRLGGTSSKIKRHIFVMRLLCMFYEYIKDRWGGASVFEEMVREIHVEYKDIWNEISDGMVWKTLGYTDKDLKDVKSNTNFIKTNKDISDGLHIVYYIQKIVCALVGQSNNLGLYVNTGNNTTTSLLSDLTNAPYLFHRDYKRDPELVDLFMGDIIPTNLRELVLYLGDDIINKDAINQEIITSTENAKIAYMVFQESILIYRRRNNSDKMIGELKVTLKGNKTNLPCMPICGIVDNKYMSRLDHKRDIDYKGMIARFANRLIKKLVLPEFSQFGDQSIDTGYAYPFYGGDIKIGNGTSLYVPSHLSYMFEYFYTFRNNQNIEEITIEEYRVRYGNKVYMKKTEQKSPNDGNLSSIFSYHQWKDCKNLQRVIIEDLVIVDAENNVVCNTPTLKNKYSNTRSVALGFPFVGCTNLKEITFGKDACDLFNMEDNIQDVVNTLGLPIGTSIRINTYNYGKRNYTVTRDFHLEFF